MLICRMTTALIRTLYILYHETRAHNDMTPCVLATITISSSPHLFFSASAREPLYHWYCEPRWAAKSPTAVLRDGTSSRFSHGLGSRCISGRGHRAAAILLLVLHAEIQIPFRVRFKPEIETAIPCLKHPGHEPPSAAMRGFFGGGLQLRSSNHNESH